MDPVRLLPREMVRDDGHLHLAPELLDACRSVSLRVGGPRFTVAGVTSAIHGEGRSTVAATLALIQAMDYRRRAILLEVDQASPSMATRFGLEPHPGLAELALGQATVSDVRQAAGVRLSVITAGSPTQGSVSAIVESLTGGLLDDIRSTADVVIMDLPPVLVSSAGSRAATLCEQLVLVVRAGVTPLPRVVEAVDSLPAKPAIVLNDVHSTLPRWLRALAGG